MAWFTDAFMRHASIGCWFMFEYVLEGIWPIRVCVQVYIKLTVELCVYVCVCRPGELTDFDCCPSLRLSELDLFFMSGVGGAVTHNVSNMVILNNLFILRLAYAENNFFLKLFHYMKYSIIVTSCECPSVHTCLVSTTCNPVLHMFVPIKW